MYQKNKHLFVVCFIFQLREALPRWFVLSACSVAGTATPRIPGFTLLPLINGVRLFHHIHLQASVDLDIRWMKCSLRFFWIGAQFGHQVI